MPKIYVEYEIKRRISVEVEVSEETLAELDERYDLEPLANYGITRTEKRGRKSVYRLQIEANRTREDHDHGRDP